MIKSSRKGQRGYDESHSRVRHLDQAEVCLIDQPSYCIISRKLRDVLVRYTVCSEMFVIVAATIAAFLSVPGAVLVNTVKMKGARAS